MEWRSEVNAEVQSYSSHHIDAQVQVMMTQAVARFYGHPRIEQEP